MHENAATRNTPGGANGSAALLERNDSRARTRAAPRTEASCLESGGVETSLPAALAAQVRRQFFCAAADAARHRVSVDEVIHHLACSGLSLGPRPQRVLSHLPDVILAVACVRGDAAAWNDLLNAHAWCLDRACAEQLGSSTGLSYARRFWSDLRATTLGAARSRSSSSPAARLQSYTGTRPIRLWLADRLLGGAAAAEHGAGSAPTLRHLDRSRGSRTLPLPTADAGGTAT
ncbi:MAG: hypothetical protein FJ253_05985 [Phycisphaerae bacterium]|nr:hypothetical protein [Phycisphaerae bacterium]